MEKRQDRNFSYAYRVQPSICTAKKYAAMKLSLSKILEKNEYAQYGQRKTNNVDNRKGNDICCAMQRRMKNTCIHPRQFRETLETRCGTYNTCRTLSGDINFVVTECVFLPQWVQYLCLGKSQVAFYNCGAVPKLLRDITAVSLFSHGYGPCVLLKTTRFKRRHVNLLAIILKLYGECKLYDIALCTSNMIYSNDIS